MVFCNFPAGITHIWIATITTAADPRRVGQSVNALYFVIKQVYFRTVLLYNLSKNLEMT